MRLYEISKEINRSNKEVVDFLKQNGFPVSGHMAVLSEQALTFIKKHPSLTTKIISQPHSVLQREPVIEDQIVPIVPSFSTKDKEVKQAVVPVADQQASIEPGISLSQLSEIINKPINELIIVLLKKKIMCTKNQALTDSMLDLLASIYNFTVKSHKQHATEESHKVYITAGMTNRRPVVVIIGHVDHGKTTLLDYIRNTKVVVKEKGGITQHLGAYEAKTSKGTIVFLDTPGHEAFSKMRSRGIRIADIAILLVAADDGVKPQTIEAIKHAQQANIPIIVALNKVDKATAQQIEAAKRELVQYNLTPEEWGGQTIVVPISAKHGTKVDELLDILSLQAEIMDLKSSPKEAAKGFVLEAKIVKGLGAVATIIGQQGTIKIGDYFVTTSTIGKVSTLINSEGQKIKHVEPSIPVSIAGFESLPQSGDFFEVISQQDYKKARFNNRPQQHAMLAEQAHSSEKVINIVIKADNNSSKEAIVNAIESLSKKNMSPINIVYSAVGDINESNIVAAQTAKAIVYGFNTRPDGKVIAKAQRLGVRVICFDVIYQLIDDIIKKATLAPEIKYTTTKVGEAVVICTFRIKSLGIIAGVRVTDGKVLKDAKIIVKRGKYKVAEGIIKSLEREKRPIKEISNGFECAITIEGFEDWQIDDRLECMANMPSKH